MIFTHLARHCLICWCLAILKVHGDGIYLPVIEYRGQPCTDKTGCDYKILACVKTDESSRFCTKDNSLLVMAVDNFNSKHKSLKNAGEKSSYPILYISSEESSVRLQFCVTKDDDIIVDEFELFVRNSGSSYHDCQIQNPEDIKRYILHSQMSKMDTSTLTVEVGLISEDCVEVSHNQDIAIPRRPREIACPPNKYGKDCSVYCKPQDKCDSGHYYCHKLSGAKICLMGWEGTECNTKVITDERDTNITCGDVNECRKGVCTNGTCCCNKGYSGVLCHSEILECESKPCLNGGTCKDGIGEYRCNCSPEYTGLQCETPIPSAVPLTTLGLDKCQSNHCQNNATCVWDEHLRETYCVCPSGIIGDQCQNVQYLLITTPSPTNCRANYYGKDCNIHCIPADSCDEGHYVCEPSEGVQVCRTGWKGKRCNIRVLPMDKDTECPELGCKNDGVCFNRTCCCRSGFYGKNCENFDIGCSSHPCQNGGTCRDDNSSYSCSCLEGYTGKSCEKDIRDTLTTSIKPSRTNTVSSSITYPSSTVSVVNNDSCLRTRCLNGGTCYLNATVATCKCPYEYTGSICEIIFPTTSLGISSTGQAMVITNFTNGHTTTFPNKTIQNHSLGLSSSTATLLTAPIQPSKSGTVSYVSETGDLSISTHLSNTSVLFNSSGLTTEGNTHELNITTTSSYEIKYATNVPSMDTSFGIKTSLSVFHMSPSYSSHIGYLTSISLNLESTSREIGAFTVKSFLATATQHYSSISSYETYRGFTTMLPSSAVNAVSRTEVSKSSSSQINVSSSLSPKSESSSSLSVVIQSTPSILTSINKNTPSVNNLQTASSTNIELQPSSYSTTEGTIIMPLYNKTSTFIPSSKHLTHPQPPNSVAVTNTFPPSPSAGSSSIIMTAMIGGLNMSITNLNKITTTPRQLVTSTTPKGENVTKGTQPEVYVFYLRGRVHKTASALKNLKALVQHAIGSKGVLQWLDIRYFVDKQGHPFTQAQFNLTGRYLADEDFLKELEKSVASSTSFQRVEASLFKGDTTDLIDLTKAHTINLVGYIYSKTDIKEAILNAWKTDTINPDIQIVDLEYCLGEYGIKLTRLSYLANSSGQQVMPWEISQDRHVQIAKVFESLDLNKLTSSVVSWPYAITFDLTVNQQQMTFKSSGTEETISSGWRRCLESNGTTCKEKCNVSVVLGRPERTIVDLRHEVSTLNYYLKVNDEMIDPVFADDTVKQCGVCMIPQCHQYQGATVKKLTYIDTYGWFKLGLLNKIHPNISHSRTTRQSRQETSYLLPDNAREEFIDTKSNTITRLWYLPEYMPDHMKDTWTNPDSYGTMTSMGKLLGQLNISVVRTPVAKLYRISLLHERQMSEFKNVVEKALLSIWTSFHSLHSSDSVKIQTVAWNVSYLSDNGTRVTVIGYRVSILDADSSSSSLTEPQLSVVEEGLQKYGIASCSCTPHSRREIYVLGDILPYNFSDFQGAISDAWNETNKFFQGNISVKIIQGTTGFKSSDGKNATQLTYFVSASSGGIPVDERDLDEPCEETLNRYLNTTNSGVANLLQIKNPKEQDDFPWWFVVIGIVLCCALMLVTITVFSLIVRSKRYSKSRTLKQHPEDINAYDQEHFSSEPSFDIPTYNLDEPDVENDSVKAEIYIVNS